MRTNICLIHRFPSSFCIKKQPKFIQVQLFYTLINGSKLIGILKTDVYHYSIATGVSNVVILIPLVVPFILPVESVITPPSSTSVPFNL